MISYEGRYEPGNLVWDWDGTSVTTERSVSEIKTGYQPYVVVSFNQQDWAAKRFWEETTNRQRRLILGADEYVPYVRTFTHEIYGFLVVAYAPPHIGEILEAVGL